MALVMTAAPAVEPISLAEAKAHLRVDTSDEDALLTALIAAARIFVERTLSIALITQSWSLYLDASPRGGVLTLPLNPVQEVTAVNVYGVDDTPAEIDAANYAVDSLSDPARMVLTWNAALLQPARRLNTFEIAFAAGFGDAASDVPAPIRHALKLLVAHWFEHREPVVLNQSPQEVPAMVASLLLPYRRARL